MTRNQSIESNLTPNTIKDDEYGTSVELNLRPSTIKNQIVKDDEYDPSLNGEYGHYGDLFRI